MDNQQQQDQQQQTNVQQQQMGMMYGASGPQGLPSLPSLNASPGHSPANHPPPLPAAHYSYGPPAQSTSAGEMNNGFLSPNFNLGGAYGNDGLRRAKSESMGHKRNAHSEDIRSSTYKQQFLAVPAREQLHLPLRCLDPVDQRVSCTWDTAFLDTRQVVWATLGTWA